MRTRFKLFLFIQYLPVGIMGPYFALYLHERQFSGGQIGLLLGVMPVVVMVTQPLWSYLSDVLHTRRWILFAGCVGIGLSIMGIGTAEAFWMVFVLGLVLAAFRAPIGPITTAILLDYLEDVDQPEDFGPLRLWGSIAFSVSSMLLGSLFLDQILVYFAWILGGLYVLQGVVGLMLPETVQSHDHNILDGLQLLPRNPNFAIYLLGSVFIGASLSIAMNYQTLFLDFLGAAPWLLGLIVAMQAVLEVPLMLLVPKLIHRFSWSAMILFGAAALLLRWLVYVFVRQPVWVLPTQILHSISIVSFMVVGVSFIDRRIHQKWRATGQGLYSTAMGGIGSGIGVYLAGHILDWFDVRAIWVLNVGFGVLGLVFIAIALGRYRREAEQKQLERTEECQTM